MDCIFCKIVKGSIPSYIIFEDDILTVFLDINPNTLGHMLIVPKIHIRDITEMDDNTQKHILTVQKKMYELVQKRLGAEGCTFAQNNGHGQDVKHYHMHVIPRYDNDGWENKYTVPTKTIEEVYNKLKED